MEETHSCRVCLASFPNRSKSAELRRGLIARASSGGNSSSSISISGWSRGTSMEALGFRLAMRGRSDRPRRSVSASETDEDDDTDMLCVRLGSLGWGMVGTGAEPWESVWVAIWSCWNYREGGEEKVVGGVCGFFVAAVSGKRREFVADEFCGGWAFLFQGEKTATRSTRGLS